MLKKYDIWSNHYFIHLPKTPMLRHYNIYHSKSNGPIRFRLIPVKLYVHCLKSDIYCVVCNSFSGYVNIYLEQSTIYFRIIINVHDHYNDVIMGATASQIASLTIVYSTGPTHAK